MRGLGGSLQTGMIGTRTIVGHGVTGGMTTMRAISRSFDGGRVGKECLTGTIGAGALPATYSEPSGIQLVECAAFRMARHYPRVIDETRGRAVPMALPSCLALLLRALLTLSV